MDLSDAVNFARTNQWSVLTTIRGSGRPQPSNVGHLVAPDGLIRRCASSVTARARIYELHRSCVAAETILAHAQVLAATVFGDASATVCEHGLASLVEDDGQ
jgi:hypothetical protein